MGFPGQKPEAELAELHFVAIGQRRRIHRLAVDVSSVEAADVDDLDVVVVLHLEFSVAAADGDVVEEEVAVGVAAC